MLIEFYCNSVVGKIQVTAIVVIVIAVVGVTAFTLFAGEEDGVTAYAPWPMDGGNPQHNCVSPYRADEPPFMVVWELDIEPIPFAFPMTMGPDDRIFFTIQNQSTFENEFIYCVNSDGLIDWIINSEEGFGAYSPVVGPDLNLYVAEGDNVSCYKINGQLNWTSEVGPEPWITVTEQGIFVFTTGALTKLLLNGSQEWTLDLEDYSSTQCHPAVDDDGAVYVAYYYHSHTEGYDKALLAVNANGSVKWKTLISQGTYGAGMWFDPIVASDGTIYISNDDGYFMAVASNGSIIWDFALERDTYIAAVGVDGMVYLSETGHKDESSYIHAIDPDGVLLWTYEVQNDSFIYPMVIDREGTILFGCMHGIYALDPQGELKWKYAVKDEHYVFSIVIGEEGAIYFIDFTETPTETAGTLFKIQGS
jgi:outer membrane protein assembly factor BamB